MALRKYKNLNLYRDYVNEIIPQIFPEIPFILGDTEWNGAETIPATIKYNSGVLSGIEAKIHNYMMYVIFPEGFSDTYTFFDQHFNFKNEELNIWVKSEGKHLRLYPWDRNNYADTEIEHKRRAVYFVSCLYSVLKWVQRESQKYEKDI